MMASRCWLELSAAVRLVWVARGAAHRHSVHSAGAFLLLCSFGGKVDFRTHRHATTRIPTCALAIGKAHAHTLHTHSQPQPVVVNSVNFVINEFASLGERLALGSNITRRAPGGPLNRDLGRKIARPMSALPHDIRPLPPLLARAPLSRFSRDESTREGVSCTKTHQVTAILCMDHECRRECSIL